MKQLLSTAARVSEAGPMEAVAPNTAFDPGIGASIGSGIVGNRSMKGCIKYGHLRHAFPKNCASATDPSQVRGILRMGQRRQPFDASLNICINLCSSRKFRGAMYDAVPNHIHCAGIFQNLAFPTPGRVSQYF